MSDSVQIEARTQEIAQMDWRAIAELAKGFSIEKPEGISWASMAEAIAQAEAAKAVAAEELTTSEATEVVAVEQLIISEVTETLATPTNLVTSEANEPRFNFDDLQAEIRPPIDPFPGDRPFFYNGNLLRTMGIATCPLCHESRHSTYAGHNNSRIKGEKVKVFICPVGLSDSDCQGPW